MARATKKQPKAKAQKKRRGSAPKVARVSKRMPAEQIEVKGAERPRMPELEPGDDYDPTDRAAP